MIRFYLNSLAATVRDLVASGKAVHVTNETAAELDLLAGLPWAECQKEVHQDGPCVVDVLMLEAITPADLALGWLLASRAVPDYEASGGSKLAREYHEVSAYGLKRAAECAELGVIAALQPCDWVEGIYHLWSADCRAHQGTREGARAAWGFVAMKLTRSADSIKENMRKPDANIDCCVSRLKLNRVADRYRRELEAM